MESCDYEVEVEEGQIGSTKKCGKRDYNIKEVEFRHPQYQEYSVTVFLCSYHFDLVFGDMIKQEDFAWRRKQNAIKAFNDLYKETRDQIRTGMGLQYWDQKLWRETNSRKQEKAKQQLRLIRKGICRLDYCNNKLVDFKNMFVIRVFPKKPTDYVNLFFCCNQHWKSIKFRIGIEKSSNKNKLVSLDSF